MTTFPRIQDQYGRWVKDITGVSFGLLTALTPVDIQDNKTLWLCRCICGNETKVRFDNLRSGHSKSCGCSGKLDIGEAALNILFARYKTGAESRGLSWEIDRKRFKRLTSQRCFYCNRKPSLTINREGINGEYIYNGIDRLDSSLGYISENIVSCCWICNCAKASMNVEEFYSWAEDLLIFLLSKKKINLKKGKKNAT